MPRERKLPSGMWKRGKVYWARFRHNGHEVRERLAEDYRTACDMLIEMKSRIARGEFGLTDNDYSWEKLKGEFLKLKQQTTRRPGDYEHDLRMFEEYSPVRSIRQIDHAYVVGFRDWRLGPKCSPRTVNREVGTLRHMLNVAVEWGRIGKNPIDGIKPLPHDEKKKVRRSLTLEELEAIFEESPDRFRHIWRMFACTGIRHEELVDMRFSDVDFDHKMVTVHADTAKNHKSRDIPLDDEMLDTVRLLQEQAKDRKPGKGAIADFTARIKRNFSRDHVFVTKVGTPWRNNLLTRFYTICNRVGIEDAKPGGSVDIHSLRVTFTTMTLENGATPKDIQVILGHSTLALTMGVYAKATERSKRKAIGTLPFVKTASEPEHIVSMQNAHALRTVTKNESQPVDAKRLG